MAFKDIIAIPGIKPVLLTLFLTAMGFGIILPLLPFYALSLGAQPIELGLLTATFAAMQLIFSPFFGKLADKIGRKKVLLLGTLGFTAAYLVFAFATTFWMAILARAIEGFFAAGIFPASISLLSDFTSPKQRGQAMGLLGMTFSLGFIFGPAFGGFASSISTHAAFFGAALFSVLNFIWVYFRLKEPVEKEESKEIVEQEVSLLSHLSSPLALLFVSSMMITFMIGGIEATLALFTHETLGFSTTDMGLIFTYVGVLIMIMQFIGGTLVNRFGEVRLIQGGLILSATGFFLIGFAVDWVSLLLPLAIFVAGNASVFPAVTSLITKRVQGKAGAILGLNNSFSALGQIIGPLLGGFLFGLDHHWSFWGMAAVVGIYFIVFSLIAGKKLALVSAASNEATATEKSG